MTDEASVRKGLTGARFTEASSHMIHIMRLVFAIAILRQLSSRALGKSRQHNLLKITVSLEVHTNQNKDSGIKTLNQNFVPVKFFILYRISFSFARCFMVNSV